MTNRTADAAARRPIRLCLMGAAPDTANLGVSALSLSVLNAIVDRFPDADLTVFDNGKGCRAGQQRLGGRAVPVTFCGANMSRRYYRSDNLVTMTLSGALGGLGNPCVAALAQADAVLDISGGDSFTDLYGRKRFRSMTLTKRLALRLGVPLILLPQTYGPYTGAHARDVAARIVQGAAMAWARDARSFETLIELLGGIIDPERHASGVDVAFALPRKRPETLSPGLGERIAGDRVRPLVGFNVSGLIWGAGDGGARQFGFKADYDALVCGLLKRFLDETDADVALIPHVLEGRGGREDDTSACRAVARLLDRDDRVGVLEGDYDATEMKWVIAQMDFFCGTRMHATIAGLSSRVPTAGVAYSRKMLGVFESCGQGDEVADPRHADTETCIETIWSTWLRREAVAASLAASLPAVEAQAADQNARIFGRIDALRASRRS